MAQGKRGAAEKNVLAVDVGNTRTRLGLFANGGLLGTCELTTCERLTVDEARMKLAQAAALMGEGLPDEDILTCVVPTLTDVWRRALAAACGCRPLVVGPGLKTGLKMRYDDPSEVGADRVADVVAARAEYGAPAVVVDLGDPARMRPLAPVGHALLDGRRAEHARVAKLHEARPVGVLHDVGR